MSDIFDNIDFSKFDISDRQIARLVEPNLSDLCATTNLNIPTFEERIQPIVDKLDENNQQNEETIILHTSELNELEKANENLNNQIALLKENVGLQASELIELKKANETLSNQVEILQKSEKEAKLESKKANVKANISIAVAIFAILADVIIAIVK